LAAVARETALGLEHRLHAAPRPTPAVEPEAPLFDESGLATNADIELWEVHSELVLVCPKVRKRAIERLPERDPEAFFARAREPVFFSGGATDEAGVDASLPAAVVGYTLWRLLGAAWSGLIAVGAVVGLALLADALH
jgi:hypothetical protein